MKSLPTPQSAPAGIRRTPFTFAALGMGMALAGLTGCADVHWERAFYDGFQKCPMTGAPGDLPCSKGPAYGQYEKERAKALGKDTSPPPPSNPIEEKQL